MLYNGQAQLKKIQHMFLKFIVLLLIQAFLCNANIFKRWAIFSF